jgi:hypothetical protein
MRGRAACWCSWSGPITSRESCEVISDLRTYSTPAPSRPIRDLPGPRRKNLPLIPSTTRSVVSFAKWNSLHRGAAQILIASRFHSLHRGAAQILIASRFHSPVSFPWTFRCPRNPGYGLIINSSVRIPKREFRSSCMCSVQSATPRSWNLALWAQALSSLLHSSMSSVPHT